MTNTINIPIVLHSMDELPDISKTFYLWYIRNGLVTAALFVAGTTAPGELEKYAKRNKGIAWHYPRDPKDTIRDYLTTNGVLKK